MNLFKSSGKAALRAVALIAVAILALATTPARARDFTWDGNFNNLWDRNSGGRTNWDPQQINNPIPDSNDNVFFHGDTPNRTIDLNGNRSVLSAEFWGDRNYTLMPSTDKLTLVDGIINASGGASHGIVADVVLEADGVWDISGSNTRFWVAGGLSSSSGNAYGLRKTGDGTLELTGGTDLDRSSLHHLRAVNGDVVLDGAHIDLTSADFSSVTGALLTRNGNITIQNGSHVWMDVSESYGFVDSTTTDTSTLTITGDGSSLTGYRLDAAGLSSSFTGSILVEHSASLNLHAGLFIGYQAAGDLTVQSGATASASDVYIGVGSGTSGRALVTGNNSRLSSHSLWFGGISNTPLGGTGTLTVDDGGAVEVTGQTKFWTGASSITIDGGTFETDRLTNDTNVSATVSISDIDANTPALTVGAANGTSTFDGLIQDTASGAGSLKKLGSGTFTLTGANTYSGGTTIEAGTVSISANENLGTGDITFTGGLLSFDAPFNYSNHTLIATSAGDARIETARVVGFRDNAIIQGEGGFVKTGSATMFLFSNNTYQGSTQILESTLILDGGAGERLPDLTDVLVSGKLYITKDPGIAETIGSLSGSGIVSFRGGDSNRSLRVGANNSDSTFDGIINTGGDGDGSLTKIGSGALTLTGANTYSGGTTINTGTLLANNATGSATGSGAVQVSSAGTLGGTGFVGGAVTANSGGTVAPGESADILTVGDVVFEAGSTFAVQLGGTTPGVGGHDQLVAANSAALPGTLDLSYIDPFTASVGDSFVILTASSVVGEFDTVNFPDGQNWTIEYDTINGTVTVGICTDNDGDGVCDADDICPGSDDSVDTDGDGVPDGCDNCPVTWNDSQADGDSDGVGDACDNCPLVPNPPIGVAVYEAVPNLAIPDDYAEGVTHTINVPDSFTIVDADVDLAITHTYVDDLIVVVEHLGISATMISRPLACGHNNYDIILDDEGTGGAIEDQCVDNLSSPPNYTPNELLSVFDGMDAAGDWVIGVSDNDDNDTGTLDRWSLHLEPLGVGEQPDTDTDGVGDECDVCPGFADDGPDADGDGVPDACDNCTDTPNADQADANGDGLGDACTFPPADAHLLLHWKLDESTGPNYKEEVSGLSNAAEIESVTEGLSGLAPDGGTAFGFTNTDPNYSYVDAGTLKSDGRYVPGSDPDYKLLDADWTIAIWFNWASGANTMWGSDWSSVDGWSTRIDGGGR